jgi:quercetin dioxygenase-like cupin family protein
MRRYNHSEFKGGWFIGDFEPSILRTQQFEVALAVHRKGDVWPKHYHSESVEYNLLVSGRMMIQNEVIEEGNIFVFDKGEIADPIFLEDCKVMVIKTPSLPHDKIIVEDN